MLNRDSFVQALHQVEGQTVTGTLIEPICAYHLAVVPDRLVLKKLSRVAVTVVCRVFQAELYARAAVRCAIHCRASNDGD